MLVARAKNAGTDLNSNTRYPSGYIEGAETAENLSRFELGNSFIRIRRPKIRDDVFLTMQLLSGKMPVCLPVCLHSISAKGGRMGEWNWEKRAPAGRRRRRRCMDLARNLISTVETERTNNRRKAGNERSRMKNLKFEGT